MVFLKQPTAEVERNAELIIILPVEYAIPFLPFKGLTSKVGVLWNHCCSGYLVSVMAIMSTCSGLTSYIA